MAGAQYVPHSFVHYFMVAALSVRLSFAPALPLRRYVH